MGEQSAAATTTYAGLSGADVLDEGVALPGDGRRAAVLVLEEPELGHALDLRAEPALQHAVNPAEQQWPSGRSPPLPPPRKTPALFAAPAPAALR